MSVCGFATIRCSVTTGTARACPPAGRGHSAFFDPDGREFRYRVEWCAPNATTRADRCRPACPVWPGSGADAAAPAADRHYEGDLVDGRPHGRGVYRWPGGARYEGEWRNDRRHGDGVIRYPDGRVGRGTWRDGELVAAPAPDRRPAERAGTGWVAVADRYRNSRYEGGVLELAAGHRSRSSAIETAVRDCRSRGGVECGQRSGKDAWEQRCIAVAQATFMGLAEMFFLATGATQPEANAKAGDSCSTSGGDGCLVVRTMCG